MAAPAVAERLARVEVAPGEPAVAAPEELAAAVLAAVAVVAAVAVSP